MTGAVRQQAIIWGNADLDLLECASKIWKISRNKNDVWNAEIPSAA